MTLTRSILIHAKLSAETFFFSVFLDSVLENRTIPVVFEYPSDYWLVATINSTSSAIYRHMIIILPLDSMQYSCTVPPAAGSAVRSLDSLTLTPSRQMAKRAAGVAMLRG